MDWEPISEEAIWDMLNDAYPHMEPRQARLWDIVRIDPEKWQISPWGDQGGGFWVVGVIGSIVLWYNDIEEGFNMSPYTTHGIIGDYRCNQDELEHAIQSLLYQIETGVPPRYLGAPAPL